MMETPLPLTLISLLSKENLQQASTWLGAIVGAMTALKGYNHAVNIVPDIGIQWFDAGLETASVITAVYLLFLGVPAITRQKKLKKMMHMDEGNS